MKIAIIGNGAVGLMIAYKLALDTDFQIDIFGNRNRIGAASKAAGAMINVFSEIEDQQLENSILKQRFKLGEKSLREWSDILFRLECETGTDLVVQKGLEILKPTVTTPFEAEQYSYLSNLENSFPEDIQQREDAIYLPTEMSLDARKYLIALNTYLEKVSNVNFINENAKFSFSGLNGNQCKLSWASGVRTGSYDHVVLAAGAFTRDIMLSDLELFEGIPDIFYGIGTALLVEDVKENSYIASYGRHVRRTMNRGGACGYHLVNCGSYYYFGATNSIHHKPEFKPRIESLYNLSKYLKGEFSNDFALQLAEPIVGFRPTTADTFPLLGGIQNDRVIFATGNKRDGLTCSPQIASEIVNIIKGKETQYSIFTPKRKLLSYFDQRIAINKAAKSYLSGRYFHGELSLENWEEELRKEVERLEHVYKALDVPPDFGIHPEVLNMFIHGRITQAYYQ